MEEEKKKKKKLTLTASAKKTHRVPHYTQSKGKTSVIIEKKLGRFGSKPRFPRTDKKETSFKSKPFKTSKEPVFSKPSPAPSNNFEKRKLAEQRATRRLKGELPQKGKLGSKKRELKLTISRALSDEDTETRGRSLASLRRAKQKENRDLKKEENKDYLKPIKRDVKIPEVITIRELANRMAEQSSNIIKHLMGMGVTATINHSINADIAEYLVQEFGHNPIKEQKAEEIIEKIKEVKTENLKSRPPIVPVMGHVEHGKTSVLDVLIKSMLFFLKKCICFSVS